MNDRGMRGDLTRVRFCPDCNRKEIVDYSITGRCTSPEGS